MAGGEVTAFEKLDPDIRFKWNDKFIKTLEVFRSIEICDDALAWCEAQYAQDSGVTWGEVVTNYVNDPDIDGTWAAWNLSALGERFDDKLVSKFVSKISNPVQAVQIAKDLSPILSESDLLMLNTVYEGKLPHYHDEVIIDG